jgi:putative PIN family toxin of toxin-antitoxin system
MRVVLDTNVVVAGLRSHAGASHELLRRLGRGELEAVLTVPLLLEYEEILTRERTALGLAPEDVVVIVDALAALMIHVATGPSGRPRLADPEDEHVVDAALAAGAAAIVTHNVRHFRGLETHGLRVLTPRQLLEEEPS